MPPISELCTLYVMSGEYPRTLHHRRSFLSRVLKNMGKPLDSINTLSNNEWGKPGIENGPYFNISHSNNMSVGISTTNCEIGIDIEKIIPRNLNKWQSCMTDSEWQRIFETEHALTTFYQYWTAKEAIGKAYGCGLDITNTEIRIDLKEGCIRQSHYFLTKIELGDSFTGFVACERKADIIETVQIGNRPKY